MTAAILFGLVSALLYGASDILARFAGRSIGVVRSMFYGHTAAGLVLGLCVLHYGLARGSAGAWTIQVLANLLSLGGTACLYRALTVGRLSVVSPVTATYGGVSAILSLMSGQVFSALSWAGLVTTFAGGLLAATPPRRLDGEQRSESGAQLAAGAALLYGVGFWLQGCYSVPTLGVLAPTWSYYTMGAIAAWAWGQVSLPSWGRPTFSLTRVAIATSLFSCVGSLALAAGQLTGQVAVTTLLSALASAVTVLLARGLLKEEVPVHGWIGLALILVGLAALKVG